MLQAVELPTGVSNLAASLADMNRDTLTHYADEKGNTPDVKIM